MMTAAARFCRVRRWSSSILKAAQGINDFGSALAGFWLARELDDLGARG